MVRLRHRTRDVAVFNEIFATGLYEAPAGLRLGAALRVLDARANIGHQHEVPGPYEFNGLLWAWR